MAAFNDFCIVCDQLIPEHSPSTKQRLACSNKKHACNSERVLYCSEQCQLRDRSSIHACLESLDSRSSGKLESSEVVAYTSLDDSDSLITSPLLLPMDNKSGGSGEEEDDSSIYCLMNMESVNTIAIPRSSNARSPATARSEMIYDHIPENNYKLWLNQKQ
ncbi:hypothetical protein HG536_0D04770 [Torulaspora globosa]|uniref:Uncharacterized protein n=1 Tax=Torulaspora globosa TaxID=48254 RepID=A0A7G3ZHG9_9SACH|nr:uncharacterized protein HG536_0D04770 [Torulaspora globosa]QLL32955.1 hypothetical protein HG536_0D04770 [Torulaspora globosa]